MNLKKSIQKNTLLMRTVRRAFRVTAEAVPYTLVLSLLRLAETCTAGIRFRNSEQPRCSVAENKVALIQQKSKTKQPVKRQVVCFE